MDDRALQQVCEIVAQIRQDAETNNVEGARIARRTNLIATTVLTMLTFTGVFLLLMVKDLTGDFLTMLNHMNVMYEHFVIMSDDMASVTKQITKINKHVDGMPRIANDLVQMNQDVAAMHSNMSVMSITITAMEKNVANMTSMTTEMAGRFGNVNATVQGMGYNVNQMARPTDMMDMFKPFGMGGPFQ